MASGGAGKPNMGHRRGLYSQGSGGRFSSTPTRATRSATSTTFEGETKELSGYFFDCGEPQHAETYTKTMDKIIGFIQRTYNEGQHVANAIKNEKDLPVEKTTEVGQNADQVDKDIYNLELKEYVKSRRQYKKNLQAAYALIMGQCTPQLKNNIEALQDFKVFDRTADVFGLIKGMKGLVFNFHSQKVLSNALALGTANFYS